MPASVLQRIFDPFFTTKPPGEGTGLGLSLCFDIAVKQLGGELYAESTLGVETEFTLKIPVVPSSCIDRS
jgi:signal transduction histidine kinase